MKAGGTEHLVVFGWGNPSRTDDGIGPELLERVERHLGASGSEVLFVPGFQLQIENALDLRARDLALFIDASARGPAPFGFTAVGPATEASFTTHALSPAGVLEVYRQVERREPPASFVLGVRGANFELGEGLSPEGRSNLEAAYHFLEALMVTPTRAAWEARAAELARGTRK